jgi:amidase
MRFRCMKAILLKDRCHVAGYRRSFWLYSIGCTSLRRAHADPRPRPDGGLTAERYEADRARDLRLAATHGLDEVIRAQRLDAVLFPGSSGAAIAARPGYPTVIVPFALVPNRPPIEFPSAFNASPQPFGVSFSGLACSEPKLLELAYGFEQATRGRVAPAAAP